MYTSSKAPAAAAGFLGGGAALAETGAPGTALMVTVALAALATGALLLRAVMVRRHK